MASSYPSGLDNQSTSHQDNVGEFIHASTINDLADAVNKIEAELGTLPKGNFSTVSAKLKALFYGSVTTTQRDAITVGNRPAGMLVYNTTTNRYEYNSGSDASPTWTAVGSSGPWNTSDIVDGAITSAKIANGTIVDADISSSAAIGISKFNASGTPSSSTYLRGDSTWSPLALPVTSFNFLTGDVSMSVANQFYDGPTISLVAGTWVVMAHATVARSGNAGPVTAKIWDGVSAAASSVSTTTSGSNNGQTVSLALHAIVTPGTTTTYKVSAAIDNPTQTLKAAGNPNPQGNTATGIFAFRVG